MCWLHSLFASINLLLGQTLFDGGGGASGRRKRTQSETTRSKTAQYEYILRQYPFEFVLTGGGNISGMFYDNQITNNQHVIEPYLQFTFEQPSTTLTVTEFDKIKLKLLCYDLSIKLYENHDSPLINQEPFLPLQCCLSIEAQLFKVGDSLGAMVRRGRCANGASGALDQFPGQCDQAKGVCQFNLGITRHQCHS